MLTALLSKKLTTVSTYGHCGTNKTHQANTGCNTYVNFS